jgi:hypothetical protein
LKVVQTTQEKKESNIPGLLIFLFTIKTPQNEKQKKIRNIKRFRETEIKYKYDICKKAIYIGLKEGISY